MRGPLMAMQPGTPKKKRLSLRTPLEEDAKVRRTGMLEGRPTRVRKTPYGAAQWVGLVSHRWKSPALPGEAKGEASPRTELSRGGGANNEALLRLLPAAPALSAARARRCSPVFRQW